MTKMSPQEKKEMFKGYLAISPWFLGFLVLNVFPIIATVYFSLTQWNIVEQPTFIGLHNYQRMFFADP